MLIAKYPDWLSSICIDYLDVYKAAGVISPANIYRTTPGTGPKALGATARSTPESDGLTRRGATRGG